MSAPETAIFDPETGSPSPLAERSTDSSGATTRGIRGRFGFADPAQNCMYFTLAPHAIAVTNRLCWELGSTKSHTRRFVNVIERAAIG